MSQNCLCIPLTQCNCGGGGDGSAITGEIRSFLRAEAPEGWLECNGATVRRDEYAALFDVIGEFCGKPDDEHFILPDLRGEFLRGWDHGRGVDPTADRALGSAEEDALQNIKSTAPVIFFKSPVAANISPFYTNGGTSNVAPMTSANAAYLFSSYAFDASLVARTSTETRPRNIAVMYCIKY